MKKSNEIEIVVQRIVIPQFLVATISLVFWIDQDVKTKGQRAGPLEAVTDLKGPIRGGVIDSQNFDVIVFGKTLRNA